MNILVFLGSTRQSQPPKPPRLGSRVAAALVAHFRESYPDDEIELIDPLDYDLGEVFKPHFAYASGRAPEPLDALADRIRKAGAYVMVSPEYNHSLSPALAHLLNHFGSSRYAYKPSLIVTYSAGQWGGVRAAVGMRTFLSELGCLPVSAMVHVPHAAEVLDDEGRYRDDEGAERWRTYLQRGSTQLRWWAEAARRQCEEADPHTLIGDFTREPRQRDAPG
jgi:NAD(P)H-dependent FMN reductase